MYSNFVRTGVDEVQAGDICALTGLANVGIGETICETGAVNPLPTIEVRGAAADCCAAAANGAWDVGGPCGCHLITTRWCIPINCASTLGGPFHCQGARIVREQGQACKSAVLLPAASGYRALPRVQSSLGRLSLPSHTRSPGQHRIPDFLELVRLPH